MIKKFIDKLLGKTPGGTKQAKKPSFGKRDRDGCILEIVRPLKRRPSGLQRCQGFQIDL